MHRTTSLLSAQCQEKHAVSVSVMFAPGYEEQCSLRAIQRCVPHPLNGNADVREGSPCRPLQMVRQGKEKQWTRREVVVEGKKE